LQEFSRDEYSVMGRRFEGEKNFHAPPVEFAGRKWKLLLGTVNGTLYKVAPHLEFEKKGEANEAALSVHRFCTEQLGKPTKQRTGLFMWDTIDGNVILQTAESADEFVVNIFLTSGRVREFAPLR
jgi:hypothetical protein